MLALMEESIGRNGRTSNSVELHSSSETERTLEMCTPRLRWIPEHSMQMQMPWLIAAQSGSTRNTREKDEQENKYLIHGEERKENIHDGVDHMIL